MPRKPAVTKGWGTAYQSEQRQPHGVQGGGQPIGGRMAPGQFTGMAASRAGRQA